MSFDKTMIGIPHTNLLRTSIILPQANVGPEGERPPFLLHLGHRHKCRRPPGLGGIGTHKFHGHLGHILYLLFTCKSNPNC